ncbi:MAG: DUF3240 domain-containing protein [bacterium]|nr:DUF3240 domain-containing protein [bacterium]
MKLLTLYLPQQAQELLLDRLSTYSEVSGFTITECQGHSTRDQDTAAGAIRDRVVGYVPTVRIELILEAPAARDVVKRLREELGTEGRLATYSVVDVEEFGRL